MKRTVDVQSDLADGVDLSAPHPVGGDGLPNPTPARPVVPPRPRLCEQGPCRNYHRLEIQLDAQDPGVRRLPMAPPAGLPGVEVTSAGASYAAPRAFYTQVTHYCYPSQGVEMQLGDLPVVTCNRWHPRRPDAGHGYYMQPADYLETEAGKRYLAEVAAWEAARRQEQESAEATERAILDAQVEYEYGHIRGIVAFDRRLDMMCLEYTFKMPMHRFFVEVGAAGVSVSDPVPSKAEGEFSRLIKDEIRRRILSDGVLPSSYEHKETK